MSTLDELLSVGDEEPGPEPVRRRTDTVWWWLAKALLWSLAVALPIWGILRLSGIAVPYPLLVMLSLVARTMRALLRWVGVRRLPDTLIRPSAELVSADQADVIRRDGLAMATRRWETRLSFVRQHGTKGEFARTVQPKLVELVDERLRLRHGLVRGADPARARAVLGEALWRFVTTPARKSPSPGEIAGLISLMEEI